MTDSHQPLIEAVHEYPPYEYPWDLWLCPVVFLSLMLFTAVMLLRRSVHPVSRSIGFITIVAATLWFLLMLPKFQGAREAAPRTQCKNNLMQIAKAVLAYHEQHERLPAPTVAQDDGPPVTWRIDLLPLLDPAVQPDPSAGYDRTRVWEDAANVTPAKRKPIRYVCPSNRRTPQDPAGRWYTAYAFCTGPGTPYPAEGALTINDIADGTSNTLLLVEACGRNIVWTEPRDVDVSRETLQINAPGTASGTSNGLLSSYHDGGAHGALADGSVRFLNSGISEDVLRALTTAAADDDPGEF